jgi:hypothetical protein
METATFFSRYQAGQNREKGGKLQRPSGFNFFSARFGRFLF